MPWSSQAVLAETVIVEGPSGGVFVYDGSGNLRSADVGQTTTDPVQAVTCYAGFSTFNGSGAIISLFSSTLDAQLWYADTGTSSQGGLTSSIASASGTDPFGNAFLVGVTNYRKQSPTVFFAVNLQIADLEFFTATSAAGPWTLGASIGGDVSGNLGLSAGASGTVKVDVSILIGSSGNPVTSAVAEIDGASGPTAPALMLIPSAATDPIIGSQLSTDTNLEWQINGQGQMQWGSGTATPDCELNRQAANLLRVVLADFAVTTLGRGLRVREGANCKQGTATLTAGTVVVANTSVTASSRIFLTAQDNSSTGALRVSARTAGTSFTITSSNAGDSGVVGFQIFEPG